MEGSNRRCGRTPACGHGRIDISLRSLSTVVIRRRLPRRTWPRRSLPDLYCLAFQMVWRARTKSWRCDVRAGGKWERAHAAACGRSFAVLGEPAHWAPGTARRLRSNVGRDRITSAGRSRLIASARGLRCLLRGRPRPEVFLARAKSRILTALANKSAAP